MSKKSILVLVLVFFFSGFHFSFASIIINEIMYDPVQSDSFNEWIELYNTDSSGSKDLTNLMLCGVVVKSGYIKKDALTASGDSGMILQAGQYAIITDGGSGTEVYDNFSIPNSILSLHVDASALCGGLTNAPASPGKTITISGPFSDSVTYPAPPAGSEGKSYQKPTDNNSWLLASSTPGASNGPASASSNNSVSSGEPVNLNNNNSLTGNTANPETKNKTAEKPKIKAQIAAKNLAFVGIPLELEGNAVGYSGEKLYSGKYFWNFGDGDSKEAKANDTEQLTHTYFYPGEYNVNLEYYMYYYQNVPDAFDRITVKVIPADISISKVGDEKNFFIELSNNTDYDADLSGWLLLSASKSFTMARNTILTPQQKMIISSKTTNFSIEDKDTLKLMTPQGEIAFDYGASLVVPVSFVAVPESPPLVPLLHKEGRIPLSVSRESAPSLSKGDGVLSTPDGNIPIENLPASLSLGGPASIISSDAIPKSSSNSFMPAIISFVFIGVSAGAVYFIRQKKIISNPGDDFAILDE